MIDATKEQQAELLSILQNLDKFEHEVLERSIAVYENGKKLKYWNWYGGLPACRVFWRVSFSTKGIDHEETVGYENEQFSKLIAKIIQDRQDEILKKKHSFANCILSIFNKKVSGS